MPVFSAFIPESHASASPGLVDILIRERREELFTGLLQLRQPAGENVVFAFVEGVEQQLYRYRENTTEVIPRADWYEMVNRPTIGVGLLKLPLDALRVLRVAHEAPLTRVEQQNLNAQELSECFKKWLLETEPSVLQIRGNQFERMYLLAPHTNSIVESVSFVDGTVQYVLTDSLSLSDAPQAGFQVTRYISAHKHDAWREYELRLAINPFVKLLMSRFNELAGRVLTDRLCEQLTLWARDGGWNIVVSTNGVADHQYFDSLDMAVDAYTDILLRFYHEAGSAVGPRIAEGLPRDVLSKLDPACRDLLLRLIFTRNAIGGSSSARNEEV